MLQGAGGLGRGGTRGAPEPAESGKGVRKPQRLRSPPGEAAPRPDGSTDPFQWRGIAPAKENVWA